MSRDPDRIFVTLADPTRRAIFQDLARYGPQCVSQITARTTISQPAVSKHLTRLKAAGLVSDRRNGRTRHYSIRPDALRPLAGWMARYRAFWEGRLDELETLLDRKFP